MIVKNLIETPCRYQGMYRVLCTRVNMMIEILSMFDVTVCYDLKTISIDIHEVSQQFASWV